jgi:hypothetical protein
VELAGMCPYTEESEMKPEDLKLCIEALKALREEKYQEMSVSVDGQLQEAIFHLEKCLAAGGLDEAEVPSGTRLDTLRVLADVIVVVTNLSDLIRIWTDYQ